MPLETVEIPRIEVFRSGGPFFGALSPPEGDTYTDADLDEAAAAANELRDEVRQPIGLGHRLDKRLRRDGAFSADGAEDGRELAEDALPAVGWLTNWRREGSSLVASAKAVPKKVAELIAAGAYRSRSAEFLFNYRARNGKTYRIVPAKMALLGATLPAVNALEDVFALYSADDEGRRAYLVELTPGGQTEFRNELDRVTSALARAYASSREPSTTRPGGEMADDAPPTREQFDALKADLDKLRAEAEERAGKAASEALAPVRAALGLADGTKPEEIAAAVKDAQAKAAEHTTAPADSKIDPAVEAELQKLRDAVAAGEQARKDLEVKAADGEAAREELRVMRRRQVVGEAVKSGRIDPGEQGSWERRYDQAPEMTVEILQDLKPRDELLRTYGADGGGAPSDVEAEQKAQDAQYEAYKRQVGG